MAGIEIEERNTSLGSGVNTYICLNLHLESHSHEHMDAGENLIFLFDVKAHYTFIKNSHTKFTS